MPSLSLNKHYNFSLYDNSVLGKTYRNAKLKSILDYHTALKFSDVELLNKQIYPYLPSGTNNNPLISTFYLFNVNGKDIVIADIWIIESSIEETSGMNYTIRLNNISNAQYTTIRDQLRLLGISFDIL